MTSTTPILSDYLTIRQLAAELGKHHRTIERWMRLRTAPPYTKVGNKVLFPRDGVIRWLKAREVEPGRVS